MDLVGYSDSEGSGDEKPQPKTQKPESKPAATTTATNFTVNKANPRKIQVRLQDTNGDDTSEPAPKRPRVGGGGAFSGFNSMLPPPKRDADAKIPAKPAARKVFSLKTGAEPGFNRESDAELRNLFAEEHETRSESVGTAPAEDVPIPSAPKTKQPIKGNAFMFKPLSVARGNKNKKPSYAASKPAPINSTGNVKGSSVPSKTADLPVAPKKVSLFSIGDAVASEEERAPEEIEEDPAQDDINGLDDNTHATELPTSAPMSSAGPQSLDSIASDLNLSKADRRQLFGRRGQESGTVINVVNFNTDQEYAANEELRAAGEQVQHNPVRAIAPGKHSLKQLVSAATGQKDALEESFATGRRNKKEAGSKYGW